MEHSSLDLTAMKIAQETTHDLFYELPNYVEKFLVHSQAILPQGYKFFPKTTNRSVGLFYNKYCVFHLTYGAIEHCTYSHLAILINDRIKEYKLFKE